MSIFDNIKQAADEAGLGDSRSRAALSWFETQARQLGKVSSTQMFQEESITKSSIVEPGTMVCFRYDAKHKETLEYFDQFPMTIIIERTRNHFSGLNLHYLDTKLRTDLLQSIMNMKQTRSTISVNWLKKVSKTKYFSACHKQYLLTHVRSRFGIIDSNDWHIASYLPSAKWHGTTANNVYNNTRRNR